MAEKRMKTKPLKNIGEFGEIWNVGGVKSTWSQIAMQALSSPCHSLWVIKLTKRSWAIMSPENGFKFRTGHNGTQLGQWKEGVCSGCPALMYDVHVCGVECGVWSKYNMYMYMCGVLTCVEQVEAPPFPNSQALSNVKRVATTPWEGPAFSNFYRAWQKYLAGHWDKLSICKWFQLTSDTNVHN